MLYGKQAVRGEWVRVDTSEEATGIIYGIDDALTRVGAAGMEQQGQTPDTLRRWSL